jgi:hypothetical protein
MPPKQSTRTQLHVTDIYKSDDTLQAVTSTAERTTAMVIPAAEIDDDNDNDLYTDLSGQRHKHSLIDNDIGNLCSQISDEDCLVVATQNRLMLEMLLKNQAQWKAEQRLEWERMAAGRVRMAAVADQWAAERAECTAQCTVGRRPNIYKMVVPIRYCGGAKELNQ